MKKSVCKLYVFLLLLTFVAMRSFFAAGMLEMFGVRAKGWRTIFCAIIKMAVSPDTIL